MNKNVKVTTDHEITTPPPKARQKSKQTSEKMSGEQRKCEEKRREFRVLQEVLQDPITVYEGS